MQLINESVISFLVAALMVVLLGPFVVPVLKRLKLGQTVRSDGPQSHIKKSGTPTMGGLMILVAITLVPLARLGNLRETGLADTKDGLALGLAIGLTLVHAFLGFADDYLKVVRKRPLGLKARHKLLVQVFSAIVFALLATNLLGNRTVVSIPFSSFAPDLGKIYPLFVVVMVVATTNAMNLTDGADGLAAGASVATFSAMAFVALAADNGAMTLFCACCAGAAFGFLWHNHYPAKVIMGDTGSLALGAALVSSSVLTKTELLLPVIGGLYVVEALSVILQVLSFRLTGKRILKMAPLHHHFEILGYKETSVTFAFWLISLGFAVLGLFGLKAMGG